MVAQTVLVAAAYQPHHLASLRENFPDVNFVQILKDGSVPAEGKDASILLFLALTKPDLQRTLAGAPGIQWIHLSTAGFDWALVPEVAERRIILTRSAEAKRDAVAEFTLAFIFQVSKRLPMLAAAQAGRRWARPDPDFVRGKTVGIIGAGAIGAEVARLASALGLRVIGTKRNPESLPGFEMVLPPQDLPQVLAASDFLVLACPLTDETRGLIGAQALRAMKPTAYLINIARGGIIVEADLVRALQEGWIAGACLDAFEQEPLPADSPLWSAPNAIITPHCAYASPRNIDSVVEEFIVNFDRYRRNEPLRHLPKNLALGY
jgi:phosphoglycerate dehydrogenase-like enzyme